MKKSHQQAVEKAESEYRKYQAKTLSPVEKEYLESLKILQKQTEKHVKKEKQNWKANIDY